MKLSTLVCVVCAWIILAATASQAASSSELDALAKEAGRNFQTKEGQRYEDQFLKAITPTFTAAW